MQKIKNLDALKVLNSRGEWTIEVRLSLENGIGGAATVPQGVSRGENEAIYIEPDAAIKNVRDIISPALMGIPASEQETIDKKLIELDGTPNKSRLGGNAILGASLAAARAAANAAGIPLWQHFRTLYGLAVPAANPLRLFINMIEGGVHSNGNLRFQEYLVIPKTTSFADATAAGKKIRDELMEYFKTSGGAAATNVGDEGGFAANLKDDLEPFAIISQIAKKLGLAEAIDFGLDAAASQVKANPAELFLVYEKLLSRFHLSYLEDPFDENDFENFAELTRRSGGETIIAGDDLTTTNPILMKKAKAAGSINGVILKPNQIGTVTETMAAARLARQYRWAVVASHRGGETDDDFIADFAYGIGCDGLKLGGPDRGERVAKYNRLLEIEKQKLGS